MEIYGKYIGDIGEILREAGGARVSIVTPGGRTNTLRASRGRTDMSRNFWGGARGAHGDSSERQGAHKYQYEDRGGATISVRRSGGGWRRAHVYH